MSADTVQDGAGNVIGRPAKSQYIPEILGSGSTHDGPFVQIEGHGGDCEITSMDCADSDTDFTGATIYDGKPIEGYFENIVISTGELVAYRKRV